MGVINFLLLSSLGLAITTQAQDCSRPTGGDNMKLKDKDILTETFQDGSKVTFVCTVGYVTAGGSGVITCTAGSWSPVKLKCERRNCGSAGEVANGNVDYPEGTEFGDKLEVTCNTGYTPVGRSQAIVCGAQGWMGRLPECEAVICDPPPAVVDGTFNPIKETYMYAEVVRYSCQKDHTLNGSTALSCSDDGTFKPDPPKCPLVKCEDPSIPHGIFVEGSRPPHRYKATVTYKCEPGFAIQGPSTLTCGINNQWLPGLPTCELVQCKDPSIPNGVLVEGSQPPYRYTSMVTYKCDSGYDIKGARTITCGIDGQWSPGLPICEQVQCKDPNIPNGVLVEGSQPPYRFMSTVTYKCNSGYDIKGARTITCGIDGQWSPGLPTCEQVQCKDPNIPNAVLVEGSQPPYRFMSTVTYKCNSGYDIKGARTITCGIDGQWSPGPPTCERRPTTTTTLPPVTPKKPPGGPTTTQTPANDGNSLAVGLGLGLTAVFVLLIICGCYFCGGAAFFKKKTRKRVGHVGPTLLGVKMTT